MNTDFLSRLDGVKARGAGRLVARCPAHPDKSPSLSIREVDDRILLHCFAGCEAASICEALGLSLKDLFIGSASNPRELARQRAQREQKRRERELRQEAEGYTLDACKQAQWFIDSRHGIDISQWSNDQLNDELNALADAYALLESEGL